MSIPKNMQTIEEKKKSELLSIGEASEYLGVSIDTLRRWEKKGRIEPYRSPGGHRYFRTRDLDALFGRKYERDEEPSENVTLKGAEEIKSEIKIETPLIEDNEQVIQEEKSSLASEDKSSVTHHEDKSYYKDTLVIPQFNKKQSYSKYDYLLGPKKHEEIKQETAVPLSVTPQPATYPTPAVISAPLQNPQPSSSVLMPSTPTSTAQKEEKPVVEQVASSVNKTNENKFVYIAVGVIVFLLVVIGVLIFTRQQILSPIP